MIARAIFLGLCSRFHFARSEWRKLIARLSCDVQFGHGVYIYPGVTLLTRDGGRIRIGARTHLWPGVILDAKGGKIDIGEHGLLNAGCYIVAVDEVSIGDYAMIAEYVTIHDSDHAAADGQVPSCFREGAAKPIRIEDDVWLAAKVTVTRGVTIGKSAVVGANAVVTRDLPPRGRYGGIPARPLGESSTSTRAAL